MIELSKRLQAVADLVTPGMVLADIGTDHGYIPIYLTGNGIIPAAIAMDVNIGPLNRAKEHIADNGLEDKIQLRLSDGLKNLKENEADTMIAAGMGGALVIRILEEGKSVADTLKECILQPQSELEKVRAYLTENGYRIVDENIVFEDGKYYPMMKAVKGKETPYSKAELKYGRILLNTQHPVLKQFMEKELSVQHTILDSLSGQSGERIAMRRAEIEQTITEITETLEEY